MALYLIDGYNLLFHQEGRVTSFRAQREEIVQSLQIEFSQLGLKGTIVFDGSHGSGEISGLSYQNPLLIAYSEYKQSADAYILEKLEGTKNCSELFVVTNDRFLSLQARNLGAHTLTIRAFLMQLQKKHEKKKQKEPEKESPSFSKKELNRLLHLFEERLNEEDLN